MNISLKLVLVAAVAIGLTVGVVAALAANNSGDDRGRVASDANTDGALDARNLPVEVLKSLPEEELAEIFPEKAEAILNPGSVGKISKAGGDSNDPEYLRAILEKLGATVPEGATTKQLQDMLAHASEGSGVNLSAAGK